MSEFTERSNVISIDEIRADQEVHATMVTLNEMCTYQPLSNSIEEIKSFCPSNILYAINSTDSKINFTSNSTCISSPNYLRQCFEKKFVSNTKKFETQGLSYLNAQKASLVSTISKMDFKIKDKQSITRGLKAIMESQDDCLLANNIKAMMNNLEVTHTKIFISNLTKATARASIIVGFKKIEIKPINGIVMVIATNNIGQRVKSEISLDTKTNSININTETIGITDGSCISIISNFNDELKKMGIKIGKESTTFTGGTCQLPYSKIIDRQDKLAQRKKNQQRLYRLLSTHKQKN